MRQLAYQPIVNLTDGQPVGVEALMRWTHPQLGQVSPAEFIPSAEERGLIPELSRWALLEACRMVQQGSDAYVSVNISAVQLSHGHLLSDVQRALSASGLPPERLVLKITETAVIADSNMLRRCCGV